MSPENKTYNTSDIPLGYLVNETCTSVVYSLDEQPEVDAENVTILSGLADGTHELTVYANDTAGDNGDPFKVWFTVDTIPPNITDVSLFPIEGNGTLEEGVQVNATVTDAVSGVEWVALNYTDGNRTWVLSEMTNLERDNWSGTIPALPHGTNITYTIIAEDTVGNTITSETLFGHPNQYEVLLEFPSWTPMLIMLIAVVAVAVFYRRSLHKHDRGRRSQ